jgi:hypothetical protein
MSQEAPRPLSLVRLRDGAAPPGHPERLPFGVHEPFLFLGEILNMPGHCAVAERGTGRLHVGYHTDNFVELGESEV